GGEQLWIDSIDAVRARNVRRLADGLCGTDDELARLVLRPCQRDRLVEAPVAPPHVEDPVRVRLLERALRQRLDERAEALRQPPRDRVRVRGRALEAGGADERD